MNKSTTSKIFMLLLILLSIQLNAETKIEAETARVLMLNSYHNGFAWSDNIIHGVEDALRGQVSDIHIEYMDTKRQYDSIYLSKIADLLQYKHNKHQFDVIITSDNNAFDFIKKYRADLFDNIPVVFCGVNYFEIDDLYGHTNITGINEKVDIRKNIDLINSLHPNCENIVIITDNTTTGKKLQQQALIQIPVAKSLGISLDIVYDISANELSRKLKNLPENTIVLYTIFFRDKNDQFFEVDQSAKLITENATVPVYGSWTFSMSHGIVGGYLANGYDHGLLAGKQVLEILSGKSANEVAIIHNPPTSLIFDYRVLKENKITLGKIEEQATIMYEPQSFFKKNKRILKNIILLIFTLTTSIIVLSGALSRMHRAKLQLASSEKRLRSIIDILPSLLFVKNTEGKFLAVNKSMASSMGLSPEEMEGKYHKDIHPDAEELHLMLKEDQEVLSTKQELHTFEKSYHDIYGNQHWIQSIKTPCPKDVFGEDAIIGLSMDVTPLHDAKIDLKAANEFNENIVETANVIVVTFDANLKIKSFNRFAEEITGYQRKDVLNSNGLKLFIQSSNQDEVMDAYKQMLIGKQEYTQYENYILTKGGEERLISWNNSLLPNYLGTGNGVLCVGIDITEKRKVTETLKESENKFKNIFENSPLGIVYYDKDGEILDCNSSFANLVGSPKELLISIKMSLLPDQELVKAVNDSFTKGVGSYNNYYHSTIVKKVTPLKGIFRGIYNEEGEIIGGIAMTEDITQEKNAEAIILKANKELFENTETLKQLNKELSLALSEAEKKKELEQANELLFRQKTKLTTAINKLKEAQSQLIQAEKMASVGILTSGIAHEINNPLNFIQGGKTAIELHLEDYYPSKMEEFTPFIAMIDNGIERAVEIIQSLNRFNRRTETYDEPCHIDQIIDNCLIMTQNQLKHRIEVIKNYDHNDIIFFGNEGKIHQVIINILSNAEQAIIDNGIITINTEIENNYIKVSFQDTGYGIKPEHLKRISDPFFTTKDPGKGTGLGLSIAYNIVHEHAGSIQFESDEGKGTTVFITFPIKNVKS